MAKVAFVQNLEVEYIGVMYLSSALKEYSHKTEVFIGEDRKKLAREVLACNPDLVGFTCATGFHNWCLDVAKEIKKNGNARIIFGGPHPTFFPEIIKEPAVDIICRGEGEGAIVDLANKIDEKKDYTKTPNCWFSQDGKIIKNDVRLLIEDLDRLPFAEREIYTNKYPYLRTRQAAIFTGRGCPYDCTYCFNRTLRRIYQNKGGYVRKRSVDNIIEEIDLLRTKSRVETIYFQDDAFFVDKRWLEEFAVKYRQKVNIPYICLLRAENINEQSALMLKKSNCRKVFFGLETGSEELRIKLLNRRITDRQIIEAAHLLKKYNIKFRTYNMLGLPGETMEDAFKTVRINTLIKTDYPWCSLLYPYPGTEIASYAKEHSLILNEEADKAHISFFKSSVIKSDCRDTLVNLQKLFFYAVKFPMLQGIIRRLIKLKPNFIFDALFLVSYGWCYLRSENRRISEVLVKGIRNVSRFYFKSA